MERVDGGEGPLVGAGAVVAGARSRGQRVLVSFLRRRLVLDVKVFGVPKHGRGRLKKVEADNFARDVARRQGNAERHANRRQLERGLLTRRPIQAGRVALRANIKLVVIFIFIGIVFFFCNAPRERL